MAEIGQALRAARMSARIDVSEIEAETKIRAKYLRALENEEWDLLPGPTFVRSFLRTYAQALGLDAKVLVEEYRLNYEHPSEAALEPIVSTPQHARARPGGQSINGPSRAYMITVGAIGLLIVLLVVLLISGGGSSKKPGGTSTSVARKSHSTRSHHQATGAPVHHAASAQAAIVALSLKPTATVYVCLIGDNGRKVIPGSELQPGVSTPTYHAKRFQITLGNSSLTMFVDGKARTVPASSQAIGYTITKANGRQPLASARLPTCK
jgi:cytoskeletal protein RodZ